MNDEHSEACCVARAGHRNGDGPDPYPLMYKLTDLGRAAVLACPHRDHDVVREWSRPVGAA